MIYYTNPYLRFSITIRGERVQTQVQILYSLLSKYYRSTVISLCLCVCVFHHLTSALTAAQNRNGDRWHPEISQHTDADHQTGRLPAPKTHTGTQRNNMNLLRNINTITQCYTVFCVPCVIWSRLIYYFQ